MKKKIQIIFTTNLRRFVGGKEQTSKQMGVMVAGKCRNVRSSVYINKFGCRVKKEINRSVQGDQLIMAVYLVPCKTLHCSVAYTSVNFYKVSKKGHVYLVGLYHPIPSIPFVQSSN